MNLFRLTIPKTECKNNIKCGDIFAISLCLNEQDSYIIVIEKNIFLLKIPNTNNIFIYFNWNFKKLN